MALSGRWRRRWWGNGCGCGVRGGGLGQTGPEKCVLGEDWGGGQVVRSQLEDATSFRCDMHPLLSP